MVFLFSSWEIGRVQALGPGLGNFTYSPGELFQPVGVIRSPLATGMWSWSTAT